jgi:hypothetical protein
MAVIGRLISAGSLTGGAALDAGAGGALPGAW